MQRRRKRRRRATSGSGSSFELNDGMTLFEAARDAGHLRRGARNHAVNTAGTSAESASDFAMRENVENAEVELDCEDSYMWREKSMDFAAGRLELQETSFSCALDAWLVARARARTMYDAGLNVQYPPADAGRAHEGSDCAALTGALAEAKRLRLHMEAMACAWSVAFVGRAHIVIAVAHVAHADGCVAAFVDAAYVRGTEWAELTHAYDKVQGCIANGAATRRPFALIYRKARSTVVEVARSAALLLKGRISLAEHARCLARAYSLVRAVALRSRLSSSRVQSPR